VRRLDQADQFAFEIGLVKRNRDAENFRQRLAARFDFLQRRRAVDVRLPDAEKIQVGPFRTMILVAMVLPCLYRCNAV
jgi:hypothetical protein